MVRLVARLEEFGWEPHVLTVGKLALTRAAGTHDPLADRPEHVLRFDDPLAAIAGVQMPGDSTHASKPPAAFALRIATRLFDLARAMIFPDRTIFWAWKLRKAKRAVRALAPSIVLSTSPSLSSHLAGRSMAKVASARWIAEFRDPASWLPEKDSTGSIRRNLLARFERWIVRRADITVTISDAFSEYFRDRYPGGRIETVPNGAQFDANIIAATLEKRRQRLMQKRACDPLVLVHAGELYGGAREPGPVIEAAMRAQERIDRPLRLRFIGSDSHLALDAANSLGATGLVEVIGSLGHAATVAETEQADAVLALLHRDPVERIRIMSKFFDYVGTGNPVLVVGEAQAMLARIVEEEGVGAARDYTDVDGMADWIKALALDPLEMSYDAIAICRKWSADSMAFKMAKLFDSAHGSIS